MNPIRVMVVDDSVVVRKIVTDVLSSDPDIEVVGTAVNGRIAVGQARAAQARPGHDGHRDAGDERHRGGARHPRRPGGRRPRADRHVQHADRARRLGHPRRAVRRRQRVRDQAGQRRQRQPVHGERPRAADPEDQGAHRPSGHPGARARRSPRRPPRPVGAAHRPGQEARRPGHRLLHRRPRGAGARPRRSCRRPCRCRSCSCSTCRRSSPASSPSAWTGSARCAWSRPPTAARSLPGTVHLAPGDHHLVVRSSGAGLHTGLNQGPPENFCRPGGRPALPLGRRPPTTARCWPSC